MMTSKKTVDRRWLLGAAVLAAGLLVQHKSRPPQAIGSAMDQSHLAQASQSTSSLGLKASKAKELEVLQTLTTARGQGTTATEPMAGIALAKKVFSKLFSLHDFFDHSRIEDAAFEQMAGDRAQVLLSMRILADGQFATSAFGPDQAVARVYATKFLTYLARQGDSTPLLETIANLSQSMEHHGEQVKAQAEDLLTLVRAYTAFVDKDQANQEPDTIFLALGVRAEDLSTPNASLVSHAMFNGLALGLNGKVPYDRLTVLLTRHFPKIAKGA